MDFNQKTVVVTGAASGIGREIALAFAHRGCRIAAADVNEEGLRQLAFELQAAGCDVYTETVDVSRSEQVGGFCDNVYREMGRVDVLCNNAGVGCGGYLEDLTLDDWEWVIGINLMGVIYGCHFFYPRMIKQGGGGHIVNIASAAGLIPASGSAPYSTSKFGVVGLSETLRAEASFHNVGVSVICPSFVLTGIYSSGIHRSLAEGETMESGAEAAERILKRRRCTAATVAEAAVRAVEKNKNVVRVCPEAYVVDVLHRASRDLFYKMAKRVARGGRKAQQKRD
jgi:NAD(P)-dependent dehydrogenase (short-subunit alcohol dehydrogenase family)